jgi:hypothetical protein
MGDFETIPARPEPQKPEEEKKEEKPKIEAVDWDSDLPAEEPGFVSEREDVTILSTPKAEDRKPEPQLQSEPVPPGQSEPEPEVESTPEPEVIEAPEITPPPAGEPPKKKTWLIVLIVVLVLLCLCCLLAIAVVFITNSRTDILNSITGFRAFLL